MGGCQGLGRRGAVERPLTDVEFLLTGEKGPGTDSSDDGTALWTD